ncbi:hypothetical protein FRX31_016773, partial [Thalictrum thalictroides]
MRKSSIWILDYYWVTGSVGPHHRPMLTTLLLSQYQLNKKKYSKLYTNARSNMEEENHVGR